MGYWIKIKDGDVGLREALNQHYSCYHYKDGRKPKLSIGPGQKMALKTIDGLAYFAWRKFFSRNGQTGINCAIFINNGPVLSSKLILEAEQLAWERWPGDRLYTYVDASKIKSINPGYCFKKAGWKLCGKTRMNHRLILEKLPSNQKG